VVSELRGIKLEIEELRVRLRAGDWGVPKKAPGMVGVYVIK